MLAYETRSAHNVADPSDQQLNCHRTGRATVRGMSAWVLRNVSLRTVSGWEQSSTKHGICMCREETWVRLS